MTLSLSLLSLFLLFTPTSKSKLITLDEALKANMIKLEATASGGHSGRSLKLEIDNLHKKQWTLQVPAGYQFSSQDTAQQDLIVIQHHEVEMTQGASKILHLYAMCTQANHISPSENNPFQAVGPAKGDLAKLVKFIDQSRITNDAAQYAIWSLTDGTSLANIEDDLLKELTASIQGVRPPSYTVVRDPIPVQAGLPAFSNEPAILKGTFAYRLEGEVKASFGLFNAEGEELLNLFKDQSMKKGNHRMKFSFEISDLAEGVYFARLHADGHLIQEEAMAW